MRGQYATGVETTYGTGVVPDRFFEFIKDTVALQADRIEANGMRSVDMVDRADRYAVWRKGATGDIDREVLSVGFGRSLKQMLGAIAAPLANADGTFTHTATPGALDGVSHTVQVGRAPADSSALIPFTYTGCKVAKWQLSCATGGLLVLSETLDAQNETTATALAVASYPAAADILSFVGGSVTIGPMTVPVKQITISGDNMLATQRYFLAGTGLKSEPKEEQRRNYTFAVDVEFLNLAQYNLFASATAAGARASVVATFNGPNIIGTGARLPSLVVSMPLSRFDGTTPNASYNSLTSHSLTGKALTDGTQAAVSVAYTSLDATP